MCDRQSANLSECDPLGALRDRELYPEVRRHGICHFRVALSLPATPEEVFWAVEQVRQEALTLPLSRTYPGFTDQTMVHGSI